MTLLFLPFCLPKESSPVFFGHQILFLDYSRAPLRLPFRDSLATPAPSIKDLPSAACRPPALGLWTDFSGRSSLLVIEVRRFHLCPFSLALPCFPLMTPVPRPSSVSVNYHLGCPPLSDYLFGFLRPRKGVIFLVCGVPGRFCLLRLVHSFGFAVAQIPKSFLALFARRIPFVFPPNLLMPSYTFAVFYPSTHRERKASGSFSPPFFFSRACICMRHSLVCHVFFHLAPVKRGSCLLDFFVSFVSRCNRSFLTPFSDRRIFLICEYVSFSFGPGLAFPCAFRLLLSSSEFFFLVGLFFTPIDEAPLFVLFHPPLTPPKMDVGNVRVNLDLTSTPQRLTSSPSSLFFQSRV